MSKKILAEALVNKVGYSKYRAKGLVDIFIGLVKRGLGDGKCVELGKLGVLETVSRKPRREITRNLKHVGPTIVTVNKQEKTVKLRSNVDLSTEEQQTRNRTAFSASRLPEQSCDALNARRSTSIAVATIRWRRRSHRVPSRTTHLRNK
jgi:nucleoid DNA-binding protein